MDPDHLKQAWQSQGSQRPMMVDAELLLREVQRNQEHFTNTIFWRDVREVGVALVMVPLWVFLGVKFHLPWAWYLTVPVLLWFALFILWHRWRYKLQPQAAGESLRERLENSLAQVEHQIWLLRHVLWWYLLPPTLSILAWFGHVAWLGRADGWLTVLAIGFAVVVVTAILVWVYWLNQEAVRSYLEPRRQELKLLLESLEGESPFAS
jgi:hypothetical protein